ncbi:MAG: thiamine phosphate synthase [Pikeienuella sp.]
MDDQARLYLVTPPLDDAAEFAAVLDPVLATGAVACVRIRTTDDDESLVRRIADQLREVAHAHDVAIVLTDHFNLAAATGVDGVHLTDPRLSVREARKVLGADAIVGAFAGVSRHDGMTMAEAGADYVSFGPVDQSALGDGSFADGDLFDWWSEMIETPVVAEGGMTAELSAVLAEKADFICADKMVWDAPEGPVKAAKTLAELLK